MQKQKKGISLIVLVITIIVIIILTTTTTISLSNSNLIANARRAASSMDKAQITQIAELIKGEYLADSATDKSIAKSVQELRERLIAGFEVTEDTNGDNIIEVNDEWAVVIKNADLDIEVVKLTDALKASSIVGLAYTTSNIVEDDVVYVTNVNLSITKLIERADYVNVMTEDAIADVSQETKEAAFYEYFNGGFAPETEFTSIDDIVLYDINNNWYSTEYTTIEECLADENVQAELGTTKEQLYYSLYINYIGDIETENAEITEQQAIDAYYKYEQEGTYGSEYYKNTNKLALWVKIPGEEETLIEEGITLTDEPHNISYAAVKNGTYEFILKTSAGKEIVSEKIKISNIATEGPYILTEEEADGVWTTNGNGAITGYTGTDTEPVIPIRIGDEVVTMIGSAAFRNNATIKTATIPSSIISISGYAFYGSTLERIVIPENIEEIVGYDAFGYCKQLKEVVLESSAMGIWMFAGCSGLESIVIPASITHIASGAFDGCTGLKNVTFEGNIYSIGNDAFNRCTSLKSIVIPEGMTTLGAGAQFKNCTSLEEITLPNSLLEGYLGEGPFSGCTNLTKIYFAPGDNPIPDGAPWGAPNENVEVIKLQ